MPSVRRPTRPARTSTTLALWLALALLVIVADQLTKTLILGQFALGDSRPVTSYFNLVRVHNTGAAFSFLAGASGWQRWFFVGLGLVASVFIVWMLKRHPDQRLFCFAITMILGGALGNVIDRLVYGSVADFLNMSCCGIENPYAFNIADIAIFVGAFGLVLFSGKAPQDGKPPRRKRE